MKLPKRAHPDRGYLTHAQVAALACAVARSPEVVRFLAYTGLPLGRDGGAEGLDFDMLRRRVNVSRSVTESPGLVWWHAEDLGAPLGAVPGGVDR